MKLLVQEYLETHSFYDLEKEHGVYASFSKSGHKFSLNYDQIEAKESDPLAQECRGLILARPDGSLFFELSEFNMKEKIGKTIPGPTKILAYPMKRFFNYGQGSAAEINWSDPNLAVLEKLDGTLCIVYYDPFTNKWCVATRSVPEADIVMDNGLHTFRSLFEKAVQETTASHGSPLTFDEFTEKLNPNKNMTFCFELTTPYNRIVVDYKTCNITLLAGRFMDDLREISHDALRFAALFAQVPLVQAHTYSSIQDLIDWVSSLNPMEHEGVVVRDSNFNRIKVKNAAYVAYNKVRDALGTSERNCVELILTEKDDDVIPMLPEEIVKNLQKIKYGVQEIIKFHDETYQFVKGAADIANLGDKKTFAIMVQATMKLAVEKNKLLWQAPFFQIFDGKASNMKDFIMKSRGKDGSWGNTFLDKMLEMAKQY